MTAASPDRPTLAEFLTRMWDEQEEQANRRFDEWRAHGGVLDLALTLGPAYVLADIAAKRRILRLHEAAYDRDEDILSCGQCGCPQSTAWPCPTVRALAAPFRDHPSFDPAWEVGE